MNDELIEEMYKDEIIQLEQVISALRSMLIAAGVSPHLLDAVEDEAYNQGSDTVIKAYNKEQSD